MCYKGPRMEFLLKNLTGDLAAIIFHFVFLDKNIS